MAEHENVAAVRRMADAMDVGDMATVDAAIADDVVWHQIGEPTLHGKDALRASFGEADYKITGKAHDIVGNDHHVVALGEVTATRAGKTLNYWTAEIFHLRDGRVVERWAFSDDTEAITRFFA